MNLLAFLSPALAIGRELTALAREKQAATNDIERANIDARMKRLQALRDMAMADRGSILGRLPVFLCTLSVALYIAKLLVWDKVLGLGATDPLTGDLQEWAWIIIGGMFGYDVFERFNRTRRVDRAMRGGVL